MISHDDMIKAIDRIGRTEDGALLYLYLQQRLQEVPTSTQLRALRVENGKRMLASELMDLLSRGLEESARSRRSDTVVIARTPGRTAVGHGPPRRLGIAADIAAGRVPSEFDTDQPTGPFGFGQT